MRTVLTLGFFFSVFYGVAQKSDFETTNFQMSDNVAKEYANDSLDNLPLLAFHLTSKLPTEAERFRAIYRWVCNNIANDYHLYERNMHKRQRLKHDSLKLKDWNEKFRKISFEKLRDDHKAICTGYAYLVKELSSLAGIRCEVVHGYAKTSTINLKTLTVPNHSWNAVQLNEKWYLCDPTWASGSPNPETFQFQFDYNDGFFLASPELFAINHFPEDKKWLLIESNAPKFEDFLEGPILYGKAYTYLKAYNQPVKMDNELKSNEIFAFQVELLKSIKSEDVSLLIDNGSRSTQVHPEGISLTGETLTVPYAFRYSGFYDVHLYIADDLISTVTVRVKTK